MLLHFTPLPHVWSAHWLPPFFFSPFFLFLLSFFLPPGSSCRKPTMPKPERKHSSLAIMQGANKPNSYAYVFAKLNALFKKADGHNASGPEYRILRCECGLPRARGIVVQYSYPSMVCQRMYCMCWQAPKVWSVHMQIDIYYHNLFYMLIKPVQTVYGTPLFDQFYRAMPQTWTFPRSFGYKLQQRIKCVVTSVFFPLTFFSFPHPFAGPHNFYAST